MPRFHSFGLMYGVMSAVTHWHKTSVRYAASVMPLMSAEMLRKVIGP